MKFSLRSLLILVTLVCALLATTTVEYRDGYDQFAPISFTRVNFIGRDLVIVYWSKDPGVHSKYGYSVHVSGKPICRQYYGEWKFYE